MDGHLCGSTSEAAASPPAKGPHTEANRSANSPTGNLLCLFYAATSGDDAAPESVVRGNRAANAWIASLRNHQPPMSQGCVPNARYYHDPELFGSPATSQNSALKTRGSVDSVHPHRLMQRQSLAFQTASQMRTLAQRESSATAERWRYVHSVLERRKRGSGEAGEPSFRRAPRPQSGSVKSILKRSRSAPDRPKSARWARQWPSDGRRHVRFQVEHPRFRRDNDDDDDDDDGDSGEDSDDAASGDEPDVGFPALYANSAGGERTAPEAGRTPERPKEHERLPPLDGSSEPGSSWAERQVAKVRQRRLWSRTVNAVRDTSNSRQRSGSGSRTLPRTESLIVNLSGGSEVDDDDGDDDYCGKDRVPPRSVSWTAAGRADSNDAANEGVEESERPAYAGWDRLPSRMRWRLVERRQKLSKRTPDAGRAADASSLLAKRRQFSDKMRSRLAEARRKRQQRRPAPADDVGDPSHVTGERRPHLGQLEAVAATKDDATADSPPAEADEAGRKHPHHAGPLRSALHQISEAEETENDPAEGTSLARGDTGSTSAEADGFCEKGPETQESGRLEESREEDGAEAESVSTLPADADAPDDAGAECTASGASTCSPGSSCSSVRTSIQHIDKRTKDAWNALKVSDRPSSSRIASLVGANLATSGVSSCVLGKLSAVNFERTHSDRMPERGGEPSRPQPQERGADEDCGCVHRAVLACLLPEAAGTLSSLETIRRQLKRSRLRENRKPEPIRPSSAS